MNAVLAHAVIWVPVAMVVALAMDLWAALLHRRAWHGPLWGVHKTHHLPRAGRLERNDVLSVLHAPLAIAFILYGCAGPAGSLREVLFGLGIGMTAFGVAYVIVHDGLVHERLPVRFLLRVRYLRAVVDAHRQHHAVHRAAPPFGLFFGPLELRQLHAVTESPDGPPVRRGSTTRPRAPSDPPPPDRAPS